MSVNSFSRIFAVHKHASLGQSYGDQPYSVHLDRVFDITINSGFINDDNPIFCQYVEDVAYMHDIIEDTDETLDTMMEEWNEITARAVQNCSDCEAPNRKLRKELTNEKFKNFSVDVTHELVAMIVKTADRYANMETSFKNIHKTKKSKKMAFKYINEYPDFREALFRPNVCDTLWSELDTLYLNLKNEYNFSL